MTEWTALRGADLAVVVNPDSPVGQMVARDDLVALLGSVGRLVVGERFAYAAPQTSIVGLDVPGLIVLRSFGNSTAWEV